MSCRDTQHRVRHETFLQCCFSASLADVGGDSFANPTETGSLKGYKVWPENRPNNLKQNKFIARDDF